MVASPDEPGHTDRVVKLTDDLSVLRIAAIYGANASGKSNLLKAINFAQSLITNIVPPSGSLFHEPFMLDESNIYKESYFEFIFNIENILYCYKFSHDSFSIIFESLINVQTELPYFTRNKNEESVNIIFNDNIYTDFKIEKDFLNFVAKGTRNNQLFLTEMLLKNIQSMVNIYSWMYGGIVFPDMIYSQGSAIVYDMNEIAISELETLLNKADTGIRKIKIASRIVEDNEIPIVILNHIKNIPNKIISYIYEGGRQRYRYNPEITRYEKISLFFTHKNTLLHESQESDGTIRLIELWENLLSLKDRPRTVIIDEINEKLHPELSRFLLEYWINNSEKRSQLIFTTHNDNLLEDALLRRDEVWMVTKNKEGASELASLVEYKIKPRTNIQKAYLHGWFNGIPRLGARRFYHTSREDTSGADPAA